MGHGSEVITYQHPNMRRVNNDPEFLHKDQLGSVKMVTNMAGARVKHSTYEPFGEANDVLDDLTSAAETKGFIGERFDADAGLQYLNARYYDPRLGMFIQPDWFDPTQLGVGTNRYSYSFNDPVNLSDPNGNCAGICLGIAAVAAYFASSNYANAPGSDGETYNRSSADIGTSMVAAASGTALVSAAPKAVNGLFAAYPRTSMLANELALAEGTGMAAATAGAAGAALPKVIPKAIDNAPTGGFGPMRRAVDDPALDALMDSNYGKRSIPGARIGNGGTADALRYEKATGKLLSPNGHKQKAGELKDRFETYARRVKNSPNPNRAGKTFTQRDMNYVRELIADLENALGN